MTSTADLMKACIGVLAFNLVWALLAEGSCQHLRLVEKTEYDMKETLQEYRNAVGKNVSPKPKEFPQLHFNWTPILNQDVSAVCGIRFMEYALESILSNQKKLTDEQTALIKNLTYVVQEVRRVKTCLQKKLNAQCSNFSPYPEYPAIKDHYKHKQWGLAALEHSLTFLKNLKTFLEKKHPHLKK